MLLLHSVLRWLVLLAAAAALVGYVRARGRAGFDQLTERLGAAYAGAVGLQVLVGLVLWFTQGRWSGDNVFLSFIHPLMMLVATGIASAGVARARRAPSAVVGLVTVVASVVVIILAIPSDAWPL